MNDEWSVARDAEQGTKVGNIKNYQTFNLKISNFKPQISDSLYL